MSNLTFLHKVLNQHMKNGEVTTYEEVIMDGPKGITVKLYSKDKNGVERISINGKDDKFTMRTIDGDKKNEVILDRDGLINELKKNKNLKFAAEFLKTQKGGEWLGRPKRASKKGSKKASRKGSRKQRGGELVLEGGAKRRSSKKSSKRKSRKGSKRH